MQKASGVRPNVLVGITGRRDARRFDFFLAVSPFFTFGQTSGNRRMSKQRRRARAGGASQLMQATRRAQLLGESEALSRFFFCLSLLSLGGADDFSEETQICCVVTEQ